MFCTKCGARVPDDQTRYCPTCGEAIQRKPKAPSTVEKVFWVAAAIGLIAALYGLLSSSLPPQPPAPAQIPKLNPATPQAPVAGSPSGGAQTVTAPQVHTIPPQVTAADTLRGDIGDALKGFRYSLDLQYLHDRKLFRVSAVLLDDNRQPTDFLNAFSRFFAAVYGDHTHPVELATITLKDAEGNEEMAMGIGRTVARTIPAITWQRFHNMGQYLVGWVRERAVANPSDPDAACFFRQSRSR